MFSQRLERLREKKGLTQKELSSRLGIARTTYSGYANGAREPDLDTLKRIADFFDVSIDFLIGRTDDPRMTLTEGYRLLHDKIDLSNDEIIKELQMQYEGMELTQEEKLEFIAIARGIFSARRALREKR